MNKKLFSFIIFIWILSLLFGMMNPLMFQRITEQKIVPTFYDIFKNNIRIIFSNLSGILTFGITSFFALVINGYVLGMYIGTAANNNFEFLFLLKLTLPHFSEYIAIWISCYCGIYGFFYFYKKKTIYVCLIEVSEFVIISEILMLFAAVMEIMYAIPKNV
jgi:uncharacterized membrane protein SpoIIM required for sporulation